MHRQEILTPILALAEIILSQLLVCSLFIHKIIFFYQVIKLSHELISQALEKKGCAEFSDEEFATAIRNIVNSEAGVENWSALAHVCIKFAKCAAPSLCILGTFQFEPDIIEKTQKERQRKNRSQGEEKRPEKLKKIEAEEKGAQKVNIVMTKIIEAFKQTQRPLSYYKVVIDPDNFMNTVDNVFQIAFLIKDGSVSVDFDKENRPVLRPIGREEKERNRDAKVKTQCFIAINPMFCHEYAVKHKITHAFLDYERGEISMTQKDRSTHG